MSFFCFYINHTIIYISSVNKRIIILQHLQGMFHSIYYTEFTIISKFTKWWIVHYNLYIKNPFKFFHYFRELLICYTYQSICPTIFIWKNRSMLLQQMIWRINPIYPFCCFYPILDINKLRNTTSRFSLQNRSMLLHLCKNAPNRHPKSEYAVTVLMNLLSWRKIRSLKRIWLHNLRKWISSNRS